MQNLSLLKRWLVIVVAAIAVMSCGSTPEVAKPAEKTNSAIIEDAGQQPLTAGQHLERAEQVWLDNQDLELRNLHLLQAAELFSQQGNCINTTKIVTLLKPELNDVLAVTHANVLLAECELAQSQPDFTEIARLTDDMAMQQGYDQRIYPLLAAVQTHQLAWLDAAKSVWLAHQTEFSNAPTTDSDSGAIGLEPLLSQPTATIWQLIQELTLSQLETARMSERELQPWVQLALISRRFGSQPQQLSDEISAWQQRFSQHPLALALPPELSQAMATSRVEGRNIAVLLPLTGRLSNQGNALKNGMLAAYYARQANVVVAEDSEFQPPSLHFFNSALRTPGEMAEMVSGYDVVIGPLLKEHIGELAGLLPDSTTLLALNRVDPIARPLDKPAFYFSLAPEDEAGQLARYMRLQGYLNPVIVTADSAVPQRMTNTFIREWQTYHVEQAVFTPSIATFTDSASMRTSVSTLLDVAQSKDRIEQVEDLLDVELHSVPRNRRDIDAMVVFASPEQTELLNPIIESSQSPFNQKAVPVFASSRSYNGELDKNSLRDLRNLTFTDMPWMLPDNPWASLSRQIDSLFPNQNSVLRRLFAMGYDAYNVVPSLRHLQLLPYNSHRGLTGRLSVDSAGNLMRSLPWGKVTNDQVVLIAMD